MQEIESNGRDRRTAISDVKSSPRHGVISLELQPQCVGVGRQVGRTLGAGEPPNDGRIVCLTVFHC